MVQHVVKQMQSEFEMSLVGELTYFLGLQVKQMEDFVFLCQRKYAKNIVKKLRLENASHKRTPSPTHLKLSKDEKGISVDHSLYRSMIGSLLYLTASRPNITFVVGVCARYQAEPKGVDSNVFPDVQTYLAKETSLEGDSSEKADEYVPKQVVHERRSKKKDNECVPEQVAHERMSNKKVDYGVNIDDLTTDKEPLTNILALGIDKRLQRRKGKIDEEEKEVEHGGDDNVGDDVEDSIDGNIDENDEDKES
ncbi:uncharacterized mitochondrial protein AtMg00810 [Lathyrus oleraceus]|uniref:uncharacterized mitochondrial protein AtMg00810 n=1 Tax=Pisum sativum TaxID=3888 RepID=UPI0021D0CC6B|nr:uncharacterized mitochondrial protein AtMg00810-like [Pisum sativum]